MGQSPRDRWSRYAPAAWVVLLTLLMIGPALLPGFVLRYDMVFTPDQTMLDWMLGLGSGLPRAAPQDALVASIAGPLPGQLLQKLVLLAIPLLAGFGTLRLLRAQPALIATAAATLMMWNPWVAERLLIGHWGLLLGYAAIPWILRAVLDLRAGRSGCAPLISWIALGSVVPTASVMTILLVLPVFFTRTVSRQIKVLTGFALIVFSATWWLPSMFHPAVTNAGSSGRSSVEVFGIHGQSWAPPFLTALSGGGIWNGEAVLPTRELPWIPIVSVLVIVIAAFGITHLLQIFDRTVMLWLIALAVTGYVVAVVASLPFAAGAVESFVTTVPGAGIIRDGQKLLVFLVVVIALATPLGFARICRQLRLSQRPAPAGLVLLLIAPLALLPDLAVGGLGRLSPAQYPSAWYAVRDEIAAGPPGDAISLPWTAFRKFAWNHNGIVLDPAPRFVTTTVLTNDELAVSNAQGITRIPGDNPRSAAVSEVLDSGQPLAPRLPELGVSWIIQFLDQPQQPTAAQLAGLELITEIDGIRLWRAPQLAASIPAPAGKGLVVAINLIAAAVLLVALGYCIAGRSRRRHGDRSAGRAQEAVGD